MTTIHPPIYLFTTQSDCWRCKRPQPVGALAGSVREEGETDITTAMVYFITSLPDELLDLMVERLPRYRLHFSKTADREYYTDRCECGANYGDFVLHVVPGEGGLFPTLVEEANAIAVEELPLAARVEVEAGGESPSTGLILEHGRRLKSGGE